MEFKEGEINLTIFDHPMAKETLSVPEESLKEVIAIIRSGLKHVKWISETTHDNLTTWCNEEEEYLKRSNVSV